MQKKSLNRLAAVAAGTMVAGLAVPILTATSAFAADPTTLSVTPTAATVAPNGSQPYTVTLNSSGSVTNTAGIYYAITAGPDASHTAPNNGLPLGGTAGTPPNNQTAPTVTGSVTHGPAAGIDTITFFYDTNGDQIFEPTEPHIAASLTANGAIANAKINPTAAAVATNTYASYTVIGTDTAGKPATGTVNVNYSETVPTAAGDPALYATVPAATSAVFPATGGTHAVTPTVVGTNTTYSGTVAVPTSVLDGSGTFSVRSGIAGTVNLSIANGTALNGSSATLSVNPGNNGTNTQVQNNDNAAALALSPKPTSAVAGGTPVTETATVKDAAGDLLGGVQVSASYTNGAGVVTALTPVVTDATGTAAFSLSSVTADTQTLVAYVEQDKNANNATGPNSGEPQDTAVVTYAAAPAGAAITVTGPSPTVANPGNTSATPVVPASTTSEVLTFHLTATAAANGLAGQTLNFTTTPVTLPAGYSLSATTGTTDANGNVAVTLTHPAGVTTPNIGVTATLSGTAVAQTATVSFQNAVASSLTVTPAAQTKAVGSTVTVIAKLTDQFGNPLPSTGVTFTVGGSRNSSSQNTGATGQATTGADGTASFTYTDVGPALVGTATASDSIAVSAAGVTATPATVTYVSGTAAASAVTLLPATTTGVATTPDPASGTNQPTTALVANVKDAVGNNVAGVTVTFTSTGVGTFATQTGAPLGSSTTGVTLANGTATVFVRSTSAGTQSVSAAAGSVTSASASITYVNSQFTAVTPTRLVDTRSGQGLVGVTPGKLSPNTIYTFDLGRTAAPLGASAYVFNVTAIDPTARGNLEIGPAEAGKPTTSVVNFNPGHAVANTVIVPNDGSDAFAVYAEGSATNVAIDLQGYYAAPTFITTGTPPNTTTTTIPNPGITAGVPTRIVSNTLIPANVATKIKVAPVSTTATQPKAVALNITAITPASTGNLAVYNATTKPTTSNINYIAGQTKAAFVLVQPALDGTVTIFSSGPAVLVDIDSFATLPAAATTIAFPPVRALDTRLTTPLQPGVARSVTVTGSTTNVPTNAQAVLVSLTSIHTTGSTGHGNLEAYPTGALTPIVSNVNYVSASTDVANFAIVPIGTNGQISIVSNGSVINAAVDILGYVPAGS